MKNSIKHFAVLAALAFLFFSCKSASPPVETPAESLGFFDSTAEFEADGQTGFPPEFVEEIPEYELAPEFEDGDVPTEVQHDEEPQEQEEFPELPDGQLLPSELAEESPEDFSVEDLPENRMPTETMTESSETLPEIPTEIPAEIPPQGTLPEQGTQPREPAGEEGRVSPSVPPSPPAFLRPAEPESLSPRQQLPMSTDIDQTESLPALPGLPLPESTEDAVVFSRIVRLMVGQLLEIPFRGTGWVYLGEMGNRRGISYDSRRLDIEAGITIGQSFIFRAETAGTYILKFYRQDFIQDYIINDYVQVVVGELSEDSGRGALFVDRGRVVAEPRWPSVAAGQTPPVFAGQSPPPAAGQSPPAAETYWTEVFPETTTPSGTSPPGATPSGTSPPGANIPFQPDDAGPQSASSTEASAEASVEASTGISAGSSPGISTGMPRETSIGIPRDSPPEEYVRQAKQEFDNGRVEQALVILDLMKQSYPLGTDEAFWLYGQLFEANSPIRDIRLALEYYRRLVNEYPQSNRVADARGRIAYLERFYIYIR